MVVYYFPMVLTLYNAHSRDGMIPYGNVMLLWLLLNVKTSDTISTLVGFVCAQLAHKQNCLMLLRTILFYYMLRSASSCRYGLRTSMRMLCWMISMKWCSCLVFAYALSIGLQKLMPGESFVGATLRFLHLAYGYTCTIVSWRSSHSVYVIVSSDLLSSFICSWPNCKTWTYFGIVLYIYISY